MSLRTIIAAATLAAGLLLPSTGALAATSQPRDNDANAIIWGGCYTKAECVDKINHGDQHNSAANIQQIMFHEDRGITSANFDSAGTVDGTVYKDGRVVVSGKTVATGAQSIGRHNESGSHKSGSVYERSTATSFKADSIPAFVHMENGVFKYAVIKSCGNAVKATPVKVATPTPAPKTPTPKPTPMSFSCVVLTPSQPDKAGKPTTFRFKITPKVSNVTITGYRFNFSDGSAVADTNASTSYIDRVVSEGDLTVHGQVKTSAGISAVSEACSATVSVKKSPAPTPTPTTPATGGGQVLGTTLPATGAEGALGGIAGITAIGYASRAYLRSRKDLLASLRNKR